MEVYAETDIGKVRKTNQDAVSVQKISDELAWSVVCDGMGGTRGGDVASKTAVDAITDYLSKNFNEGVSSQNIKEILMNAAAQANTAVFEKAQSSRELRRMGTTLVMCAVFKDKLYVVHAGDSRAYVISDSEIFQVSRDHSVVQQMVDSGEITALDARNHPQKNIITRALGVKPEIEFDYTERNIGSQNAVLLCTDGLTNHVPDKEILELYSGGKFSSLAKNLIKKANKCGGNDNITVAVIKN